MLGALLQVTAVLHRFEGGMGKRIRGFRDLARPEKGSRGPLPGSTAGAAREWRCQQLHGAGGLLGDDAVAERGELGRPSEPLSGGDPARLESLHPLDEFRAQASARVGGRWCGAGERLPSGDGGTVRSPSPVRSSVAGLVSDHSGRTSADSRGRRLFPGLRRGVPVRSRRGAGSSEAAAEGSVMSPLPWRWFGEPLIPSEAFGVGSSHSTSSARFGPWPPLLRFAGCWEPPFLPMLLVGVLRSVSGGPGGEEGPLAAVRGSDIGSA